MHALLSRRSIRRYLPDPIDRPVIRELLAAAMAAPSAGNQQPWHFVVITDRTILDRIPTVHPYARMVLEAPCAILVAADPTVEKHKGYWVQDCSAATENLLIAAQDKGLGAVWLGVYPREDRVAGFKTLLSLAGHIVPFACIPLGKPAEYKEPANRYDENKVHYNGW
jgi:nitroreductase